MTYFPPISSIIAHIDHGKSTLADRLLEYVGAIDNRSSTNQRILDNLKVEKDRGITVKAQTASVIYKVKEYPSRALGRQLKKTLSFKKCYVFQFFAYTQESSIIRYKGC